MWQSLFEYGSLTLSAFIAGGINALAGGGTLLTFPTLIGIFRRNFPEAAEVLANGTSTVGLVPASLGSVWGYRRELMESRGLFVWLLPPSVIGGVVGALLVTRLPPTVFANLVPWLILTAASLFALQPLLVRRKAAVVAEDGKPPPTREPKVSGVRLASMVALQLLISLYGGYFGAGIGILMLSGFGMMGFTNIHQMNGLKVVLATAINGVAVGVFVIERQVVWPYALAMMAASLIGGYGAAHFGRQIPGKYVRYFVIAVGFLMAAYFFLPPK